MGEVVIALNADSDARWYGLGETGVGHLVMVGEGFHNDPLAYGTTLYKPCAGKELETARLTERFQGDARCKRCVSWLACPTGVSELEAARADKWAAENGSESLANAIGAHTLITLDGVTQVPGPDTRENSAPAMTPEEIDEFVADVFAPDPAPVRPLTREDVREAVRASRAGAAKGKRDAAVRAERERLTNQRAKRAERDAAKEVRENSAPAAVAPAGEVIASTGLTMAEMLAEIAAYYANGGTVPAEIVRLSNRGAGGPVDLSVLPCEFKGPVSVINMERTHGKCPGCTTYIPLLPEASAKTPAKPKGSGVKCDGTGEAPVPGSRVERDDHAVSVPDDFKGKHSGECPGCARIIAVSREGGMRKHNGVLAPVAAECESVDKIGTHNVGGLATPAVKGRLKDKSVELVEHGSVPGDPGDANARRGDETRCPRSNKVLAKRKTPGNVECPNKECGRTVELKAKPRKDGTAYVIPTHVLPGTLVRNDGRNVTPFGTGADAGKGARDHGSVDGSAIVSAVDMPPVQPGGWLGKAGTGQLPAGLQSGIDPVVSGDWCPVCKDLKEIAHKGKSRGWRRNHSYKVGAVERERAAKRDAAKVAEIKRGEAIPARVRKALRTAVAVGSFAEGVNAHTGAVTHGERPARKRSGK